MATREPKPEGKNHGLADHQYGDALTHRHDSQSDHDHDDFEEAGPLEENPLWIQDHVTLTSVGIDIGSSGTQIIFSKINLRRLSEELTSRYYVVSRETLFLSPVSLTPYQSETRIDDAALQRIIDEAYRAAGIAPTDIDTGAVILTGEALRRENAQAISGMLAAAGGDFVCATAGHHMESMLAAYGSGASRVSAAEAARILNIDIGGGTTKLALVENGRVIATAAVHIGGRLQVVDADRRIVRLDPAGRTHARRAGFDWKLGDVVEDSDLDRVADVMADTLMAALSENMPHDVAHLYLTDPLSNLENIAGIMASGGVAEYIYGREARDFSDMGRRLGRAIRRKLDAQALAWPLLPAGECIRATALGASEYSVQLSGNTSYISNPGSLLPRRNLQVLQPPAIFGDIVDADAVARAIGIHRKAFESEDVDAEIALAFHWQGAPAYERIHALARGIAMGLADKVAAKKPIYIMLDGDIAQTLGHILREDCGVGSEILCIDGVMLMDFDYIDLGRVRVPSYTVPVTIKSLVFSDDPHRTRERIHHHDHHHHDDEDCQGHHHHGHHHHHHD
ncbi:MAG TPA: ethanolamine ammonia-lyase reactivating factor EutA [Micropepsaceae bacterium]|nr:ethanolamine ammonia-lyase reactivating factor EutA [Micropepsaceae bacterium]